MFEDANGDNLQPDILQILPDCGIIDERIFGNFVLGHQLLPHRVVHLLKGFLQSGYLVFTG